MLFCFEAAGRFAHVGRWNTFVSVLPINIWVDEELSLDDPPDVPPEVPPEVPEPDPPLTLLPPGKVKVAPSLENMISPF